MSQEQIQKILTNLKEKGISFYKMVLSSLIKIKSLFHGHVTSWPRIVSLLVGLIIFLYYPLGGLMIHNIDTSSTYQPSNKNNQLAVVDMSAYLINREVYYKLWTPSLPFMFPSYFLDDMPNFQQGIMSSIDQTISALAKSKMISASETAQKNISLAEKLLSYPGNIWLFSPQNHLVPAPSSATQYKKGRKSLKIFNQELENGRVVFEKSSQNLSLILKAINTDINKLITKNEAFIRESKDTFINFKTDDTFYFTLGKLYAYAQILKSLGIDFKQILINENIYEQWISVEKTLEQASTLKPMMVRNGNPNSSFVPNHIITINYYAARSYSKLKNITLKLDK